MFNSRAHYRRQQKAHAARPRLRRSLRRSAAYETLESRWLLSAAPLDFTTLSLPVSGLTQEVGQFAPPAGQLPQFTIVSEGGFIQLDNLSTQGTSAGLVLSGVVRSGASFDFDTDTVLIPSANGTTDYLFDYTSGGTGFNLRPAVITPVDHGSHGLVVRPNAETVVAGEPWHGAGRQEGGSIHIESILRKDEPFSAVESGERLAALPAKNAPDQSAASQHSRRATNDRDRPADSPSTAAPWTRPLGAPDDVVEVRFDSGSTKLAAPSYNRDISGEWARAIVFEMAGGEPAWATRSSASDHVKPSDTLDRPDNPRAVAPLPSATTGQEPTHRAAAARHPIADNGIDLKVAANELSGSQAVRSSSSSPAFGPEAGSQASGLAAFNVSDAAYDEVFGQLGHGKKAAIRPSADDEPQSEPIAAAPLLAVLALQHIASRYWSRSNNKNASAVVAGPPRT